MGPIPRAPQTNIPGAGAHARHDPRIHGPSYHPRFQGDQAALQDQRNRLRAGLVSMDDLIEQQTQSLLPPQLVQVSFIAVIPAFGVSNAQLLIPKNPLRWSFLLANYTFANLVMFSFDRPVGDIRGGDLGAGVPISGSYQESNGAVSTNDIWVWCNDPAVTKTGPQGTLSNAYPVQVIGYQGQLSPIGKAAT